MQTGKSNRKRVFSLLSSRQDDDVALVGARLAGWDGAMDTISARERERQVRLPIYISDSFIATVSDSFIAGRSAQRRPTASFQAGGCCLLLSRQM
eukprot:COSAG06_NODE_3119_length_5828_cov_3.289754_1_plen_94_part_10